MTTWTDTRHTCGCGDVDLTHVDTVTRDGTEHPAVVCLDLTPPPCGHASPTHGAGITCALPTGHAPPHMHGARPLRWWQ